MTDTIIGLPTESLILIFFRSRVFNLVDTWLLWSWIPLSIKKKFDSKNMIVKENGKKKKSILNPEELSKNAINIKQML